MEPAIRTVVDGEASESDEEEEVDEVTYLPIYNALQLWMFQCCLFGLIFSLYIQIYDFLLIIDCNNTVV